MWRLVASLRYTFFLKENWYKSFIIAESSQKIAHCKTKARTTGRGPKNDRESQFFQYMTFKLQFMKSSILKFIFFENIKKAISN